MFTKMIFFKVLRSIQRVRDTSREFDENPLVKVEQKREFKGEGEISVWSQLCSKKVRINENHKKGIEAFFCEK